MVFTFTHICMIYLYILYIHTYLYEGIFDFYHMAEGGQGFGALRPLRPGRSAPGTRQGDQSARPFEPWRYRCRGCDDLMVEHMLVNSINLGFSNPEDELLKSYRHMPTSTSRMNYPFTCISTELRKRVGLKQQGVTDTEQNTADHIAAELLPVTRILVTRTTVDSWWGRPVAMKPREV